MDKLDNETWEDYAFKNNLFAIKYADKEKTVIDDINIPIHTNLNKKHYNAEIYKNRISFGDSSYICFIDFIMSELYNLRNKYNTGYYDCSIQIIINMTKDREEDINRQKWLFQQLAYWENKYMENERDKNERERGKNQKEIDIKNRYFELKTKITLIHKDQLDELLAIIRSSSIERLEGEIKSNMYSDEYWREKDKENEREKIQNKKKRIELYEKYLKNKDIQIQIMELEQKLNQLKGQIVK
jgi:hypothetical protein